MDSLPSKFHSLHLFFPISLTEPKASCWWVIHQSNIYPSSCIYKVDAECENEWKTKFLSGLNPDKIHFTLSGKWIYWTEVDGPLFGSRLNNPVVRRFPASLFVSRENHSTEINMRSKTLQVDLKRKEEISLINIENIINLHLQGICFFQKLKEGNKPNKTDK